MRMIGYIGRCPRKDCEHATRGQARKGECPEHGRYALKPLHGEVSTRHACNADCMSARGPRCVCSCGGENHGAGFASGAYAPRVETLSLF